MENYALVTGASQGLGKYLAIDLAKKNTISYWLLCLMRILIF